MFFTKSKIKFVDQFNQLFWVYHKEDDLILFKKRKSVTDAINIINYLNKTNDKIDIGIDVGANIGAVSIAMWNKAKYSNSRIFSIEADPNNIPRIQENLLLNNKNISNIINLAISDIQGQIELTRFPNCNGWQTISKTKGEYTNGYYNEKIIINSNTLEGFLKFYNINKIDLIKIDIEGAELLALQSIKNRLLNREISKIIFEVNQHTLVPFGESISSILNFWNELPYRLQVIEENGDLENVEKYVKQNKIFFDCIAELK